MADSGMLVNDLGEFTLIEGLTKVLENRQHGIGDDAAVYPVGDGQVHVLTTDALIEGIHFDRSFMPMEYIGFKALSVNVSDVVAMNATPRYATVALGIPGVMPVNAVEALYRGIKNAADVYGVTIVGGDTTKSRELVLSLTVVGEAQKEHVVYRHGACPGDLVCVTGNLGAAYAGLKLAQRERRKMKEEKEAYRPDIHRFEYAMLRLLAPVARLQIIQEWAACNVQPTALIDISDGLASEMHHICRLSSCGAVIQALALPVVEETRKIAELFGEQVLQYALLGGDDYELLFTIPEEELHKLNPNSFCVIGQITDADRVVLAMPSGATHPLPAAGHQHFTSA